MKNQTPNQIADGKYLCPECEAKIMFKFGKCITCTLKAIPWREGDKVRVKSIDKEGTVVYRYYNGFTLVKIAGKEVEGGAFNNNSTYRNNDIELVT